MSQSPKSHVFDEMWSVQHVGESITLTGLQETRHSIRLNEESLGALVTFEQRFRAIHRENAQFTLVDICASDGFAVGATITTTVTACRVWIHRALDDESHVVYRNKAPLRPTLGSGAPPPPPPPPPHPLHPRPPSLAEILEARAMLKSTPIAFKLESIKSGEGPSKNKG